jgi:2-phosphoglycerate kinase
MSKIILIGGVPRSGKTTLAKTISEKLNVVCISTDDIDDGLKEKLPKEEIDKLFPKTALRIKSGGGNDEMYSSFTTEEIVSAYLKQAEAVWPAVSDLVRSAIREKRNCVIEGYHVTPKLIAKLNAENLNVSSVVLVSTAGEDVIERSIKSDTKQDWLRDKTKQPETFQKVANMISLFSEKLIQEAVEHGVKIIDTSEDFPAKFEEAINYLIQPRS